MILFDEESGKEYPVSESDRNYLRREFITLEQLSKRTGMDLGQLVAEIASNAFPKPAYKTDEGWFFPAYYANIMKAAERSGQKLKEYFFLKSRKLLETQNPISDAPGLTDVSEGRIEAMWNEFLTGLYGACLIRPEPATILQKERLMAEIDAMLANPDENNARWLEVLCTSVDSLDAIENRFADVDRVRFNGPVSRDVYITGVREKYCSRMRGKSMPGRDPTAVHL